VFPCKKLSKTLVKLKKNIFLQNALVPKKVLEKKYNPYDTKNGSIFGTAQIDRAHKI
jgi:hypothetical protein